MHTAAHQTCGRTGTLGKKRDIVKKTRNRKKGNGNKKRTPRQDEGPKTPEEIDIPRATALLQRNMKSQGVESFQYPRDRKEDAKKFKQNPEIGV